MAVEYIFSFFGDPNREKERFKEGHEMMVSGEYVPREGEGVSISGSGKMNGDYTVLSVSSFFKKRRGGDKLVQELIRVAIQEDYDSEKDRFRNLRT